MFKNYNGSVFGAYNTLKFSDVWDSPQAFTNELAASGLDFDARLTQRFPTLFLLLYSRYGNSHFANMDLAQSKYKVFATIWQWGPAWAKKLELQQMVRDLSEEELSTGNITLGNTTLNTNETVADPTAMLSRLNDQHAQITKRGKIEQINSVIMLIENDVTEQFLDKFKPIFAACTTPSDLLVYDVDEDVDDIYLR